MRRRSMTVLFLLLIVGISCKKKTQSSNQSTQSQASQQTQNAQSAGNNSSLDLADLDTIACVSAPNDSLGLVVFSIWTRISGALSNIKVKNSTKTSPDATPEPVPIPESEPVAEDAKTAESSKPESSSNFVTTETSFAKLEGTAENDDSGELYKVSLTAKSTGFTWNWIRVGKNGRLINVMGVPDIDSILSSKITKYSEAQSSSIAAYAAQYPKASGHSVLFIGDSTQPLPSLAFFDGSVNDLRAATIGTPSEIHYEDYTYTAIDNNTVLVTKK